MPATEKKANPPTTGGEAAIGTSCRRRRWALNEISSERSSRLVHCASFGKTEMVSACAPSPPSVPVVRPKMRNHALYRRFSHMFPYAYRKINPIERWNRSRRTLSFDWVGRAGEVGKQGNVIEDNWLSVYRKNALFSVGARSHTLPDFYSRAPIQRQKATCTVWRLQ